MFEGKIKYFVFILIFLSILAHSEDRSKDPVKWSQYQGKKTWQEAKEHCQTMKMRLPTISELKLAEDSGTTKGWRKYGTRFWAVNKNDTSTYKVISLLGNDNNKKEENHKNESSVGVFCANVTLDSTAEDSKREKIEELILKYSEYQGHMDWESADRKCKSISMRLPTIDELKEAYYAGITKSWLKDGDNYWSSTPYGRDVRNDYASDRNRSTYYGVRCRR